MTRASDAASSSKEAETTRTDAAHGVLEGGRHAPVKKPLAVRAGSGTMETAANETPSSSQLPGEEETLREFLARLRTQSTELASTLKRQQGDLDRRENMLQQRAADLENQMRKSRLIFSERERSLEELNAELDQKNQELLERQARDEQLLAEAKKEADGLRRLYLEIDEKHQSIQLREASLMRKQEEIAAKEQDLAALQRQLEVDRSRSQDEIDHFRSTCQERLQGEERDLTLRRQRLQAAEDLLAQRQQAFEARVSRGQEQLEQSQAMQDRLDVEAERRRRAADDEIAKKQEDLKRREEDLEVRSQAVERLREDLASMHRDTLELRLATEEMWSQLAGAVAPLTLSQSLMRIRNRLQDDYRLQREELETQKKELVELSNRIKGQHDQLATRTSEFRDWMRTQQEQLAKQADQLVLHRRQLEQREAEANEERGAWERSRDEWLRKVQLMLVERERLVIPA